MGPSRTEIQKFSLIDLVRKTKKKGFSQISQLLFVLGHMLLPNSYMNVLIAFT